MQFPAKFWSPAACPSGRVVGGNRSGSSRHRTVGSLEIVGESIFAAGGLDFARIRRSARRRLAFHRFLSFLLRSFCYIKVEDAYFRFCNRIWNFRIPSLPGAAICYEMLRNFGAKTHRKGGADAQNSAVGSTPARGDMISEPSQEKRREPFLPKNLPKRDFGVLRNVTKFRGFGSWG